MFCSCSKAEEAVFSGTDTTLSQPAASGEEEDLIPERPGGETVRVTLVAVGDNLLHMPIVRWCRTPDGYDFTPLYRKVKDLIQDADMAFVNQEGPLGGEGFAPSDYPYFNAPQEAGRDLADIGFTIVSQANNHGLDQGAEAVLSTADFWEQVDGVTMIGMSRSEQERRQIDVVEVRGIRFAWLAYSYGTNGLPMQDAYLMNLIDRNAMVADIAAAKESSDAVIVSMHWGDEYQFHPSREQQELAQFLADQGVALVIGHHPHVIQPLTWVKGRTGNQTLVAYSLGNFVSNQGSRDTMPEGMLSVVFARDEFGVAIEEFGVLPLIMHYEEGNNNHCVYPVYEYTEYLARRHSVNQAGSAVSIDWIDDITTEIWGNFRILRI
jgi:poly-gamma-glutamate synthesis protein (capsule biosynthesis protein)